MVLPIPVSGSGVIFDVATTKAGVENTRPPDNALSLMISPLASRGEWQLPQASIALTR
jgi:hypothetical protein